MLTPKKNSFFNRDYGVPIGLPIQTPKKSSLLVNTHTCSTPEGCKILALQSEGSGCSKNSLKNSLDTLVGIDSYTLVTTPDPYVPGIFTTAFNNVDFDNYDVIIVGWSGNSASLTPDATEVSNALSSRKIELEKWIRAGGSLIALPDWLTSNPYSYLPLAVTRVIKNGEDVIIAAPTHPIMENLTNNLLSNWLNSYHILFNPINTAYLKLAQNNLGEAVTLAATLEHGNIILTGQDSDWHIAFDNQPGADTQLSNMIKLACTQIACPEPNPRTCCQLMLDHKTQLVPPALIDCTHDVRAIRIVEAAVEKVCPEKVVICGVIHKKITYTPVDSCGRPSTCTIDIFDDFPFQCFIDRDDATLGANFRILGAEVMCVVFDRAQNFGKHPENPALTVAWKFVEKDIIKVCIERQEPRSKICE